MSELESRRKAAEAALNAEKQEEEAKKSADEEAKNKFAEKVEKTKKLVVQAIQADPRYVQLMSIFDKSIESFMEEVFNQWRPKPVQKISGYEKKTVVTGHKGLIRKTPIYKEVNGNPIYTTEENTEKIEKNISKGISAEVFVAGFNPSSFAARYLEPDLELSDSKKLQVVNDYFQFIEHVIPLIREMKEYQGNEEDAISQARRFKPGGFSGEHEILMKRSDEYRISKNNTYNEIARYCNQMEIDLQKIIYNQEPQIEFKAFGHEIEINSHIHKSRVLFQAIISSGLRSIHASHKTTVDKDWLKSVDEALDFIALNTK